MTRGRHIASPSSSRRGVLFVIVLWVCFGLIVMAIYFGDAMRLEYRAAENANAERAAAAAVDGAKNYILYAVKNNLTSGEIPDPADFRFEAVAVGEAKYWVIGRSDLAGGAQASGKFSLNSSFNKNTNTAGTGGNPVFNLVDESSKLNLNTATFDMLQTLPGMTAEMAGAIVDWRDSDSDLSDNGAEDEVYMLLKVPYLCKNARFETVEELRLVNGATWEILRGEDANFNGVLDANENDGDESYPPDNADGKLDPGILEYVTVYTDASTTDTTAGTLSSSAVSSALESALGSDRAQAIAQSASGQLGDVHNLLQLAAVGGMTSSELDSLIENGVSLSFPPAEESGGPVNINTAPAAVLSAVLGGDTAVGEQIVAARAGRSIDDQAKMGWVLDAVDPSVIAEYGAALTNKAHQFSADIAAVGPNGRGYRRDLFIIDAGGSTPRVRYHRDRTRLGWPLGGVVEAARNTEGTERL
ncbi:MAG: helix-hairpin-helix domain-containing protein [Candidatus Sumerlaeia bacterium]